MLNKFCEFFFHLLRVDSPLMERIEKITPLSLKKVLRVFRKELLYLSEKSRIRSDITSFLGPEYPPRYEKIEINITYNCNLRCRYCNRFVDIAPCDEEMSVGQIENFVRESIESKKKWKIISLSGGEALLHPRLTEILNVIISYKNTFSPQTKIWLATNGMRKSDLAGIPSDVYVLDSGKDVCPQSHIPVTAAPVDIAAYKDADFVNGCDVTYRCGMGLDMHGYYQCAVAAAIDRVFGFDIGRKTMPSKQDNMSDLYRKLCGYCGHFLRSPKHYLCPITPSWAMAIGSYLKKRPCLTRY
ncbi:MAG: radical SAM protein [Candidatus Pacebacteria bacterium]|nr:radical SAM protein [Candidatus Paceibacterota bacterium]